MRIKSLKINNLRNISGASLVPHPDLNILHGDNGAGKTGVIEALVVLGKGRSFRSAQIAPLIGPDSPAFLVMAETVMPDQVTHRLGLERSRSHWNARIDGQDVAQVSELASYLPFTLMEPNSHQLINGSPDVRRRFLDWGVFHVKHEFLSDWRNYSLAVRQRNAALRIGDERVAQSLDTQIIRYGTQVDAARRSQTEALDQMVRGLGDAFMPAGLEVHLEYDPGWRGDSFEQALADAWRRDLDRGATNVGPHRAELHLSVGGKPARDRLSRGEQKLLAAALLLAQARILATRQIPLLLLDDLASEFDSERLAIVLEAGRAMGAQLWVTGTEAADYLAIAPGEHRRFHVKQGRIEAEQSG